jgi:hypothetical protein
MSQSAQHRGYALLITVVMLALLAVILGGMARRSADTALQARAAEYDVRQRWAALSCQQTVLAGAPERFEQRTEEWLEACADEDGPPTGWDQRPAPVETLALELRGVHLWLRIDDEQAKQNLNHALRTTPEARVAPQAIVAETLAPTFVVTPALTRPEFVEALDFQPISSWDQVLPSTDPLQLLGIRDASRLVGTNEPSDAPANRVTLWGDGRLNLFATSDETLRRVLRDKAEPATIELLLRLRREDPGLGLQGLIDNVTAEREDDRAALNAALTDRSRCFTLWLACKPQTPDNAATHWSISVIESAANPQASASGDRQPLKQYRW